MDNVMIRPHLAIKLRCSVRVSTCFYKCSLISGMKKVHMYYVILYTVGDLISTVEW